MVNPFNKPNDKPSGKPFVFADEGVEKTPLSEHEKYDRYVSGNKGPNEGAGVNGTLTEEQMEPGKVSSNIPPGGRGGLEGVGQAADRMQDSYEGGRVYKGSMVQGKASVSMFGDSAGLNDNTPAKPKVVSNPNTNIPTYG